MRSIYFSLGSNLLGFLDSITKHHNNHCFIMMNTVAILSVNKYNEDFEHNEAPSEFSGHKWSLQTFWKYLEKEVSILNIFWRRCYSQYFLSYSSAVCILYN